MKLFDLKRMTTTQLKNMLKSIYSESMSLRDIIFYNAIQNELDKRRG